MGLVGDQIRYKTKESFDGNETVKTKVKTWHFREGEMARRTKQEEFENGMKLWATRERIKKVSLESD